MPCTFAHSTPRRSCAIRLGAADALKRTTPSCQCGFSEPTLCAQAWRVYNRTALDFNLFFCSRMADALEQALPDDERAVLPLVWRAGVDDWDAYLCSHFKHIRYHHFKQAACAPILKDNGL